MRAGLVRRFLLFGTRDRGSLKIDAPEVRCRRQKLHAHSGSFAASFSQVNNPAFLLFLRFRIHQNQHFAIIDFVAEVEQAPVGTHHQRFANFPKLTSLVAASLGLQPHFVKDALAATL